MDVAIRASATAVVPRDYTVPGAQEILPKSVTASMDGTGAASTWFPCLQLLEPGGNVMFSAVSDTSVAAGASVDVSWFPGIKGRATSSGGGSLLCARANIVGNQSITAGDPGQIVIWGEAPIDNGSPSPFWSVAHPSRLTAPVSGVFLFLANIEWDILDADTDLGCYLYKNGSSIILETFLSKFDANPVLSSSGVGSNSFTEIHQHHNIFSVTAGDYFELLVYVQPSAGIPAAVDLIDKRPALQLYSSFTMIQIA